MRLINSAEVSFTSAFSVSASARAGSSSESWFNARQRMVASIHASSGVAAR